MNIYEPDWAFVNGAWLYSKAPDGVYCEVLYRRSGWGFKILVGLNTFVNVAPYRSRLNAMIAALRKLEEVSVGFHV